MGILAKILFKTIEHFWTWFVPATLSFFISCGMWMYKKNNEFVQLQTEFRASTPFNSKMEQKIDRILDKQSIMGEDIAEIHGELKVIRKSTE